MVETRSLTPCNSRTRLESELVVVLVVVVCILRNPEDDSGEHDADVLCDVGVSVVKIVIELWYDVLEDEDAHTPSQTASHQSKTKKEEQANPPHKSALARTEGSSLAYQLFLIDKVYDEQAECAANAGNPIEERDMNGNGVIWRIRRWVGMCRKNGGIQEYPMREAKQQTGDVNS